MKPERTRDWSYFRSLRKLCSWIKLRYYYSRNINTVKCRRVGKGVDYIPRPSHRTDSSSYTGYTSITWYPGPESASNWRKPMPCWYPPTQHRANTTRYFYQEHLNAKWTHRILFLKKYRSHFRERFYKNKFI